MDFDLDDPLGDLLSDGSNDSFFGTSKKAEQTTAKKSNAPKTAQSSSAKVANLFGIESDANAATSMENAAKSMAKTPQSPFQGAESRTISALTPSKQQQRSSDVAPERVNVNEPVRTAKKEATHFDDSDDFLNELGFDPKHPKGSSNIAKKSSILDDILNFSKADPLPKTSSSVLPSTPIPKPTANDDADSRRSTKPVESTNRYSPSLGAQGRPRRSGSSGPIADPLGLFTAPATKKSTSTTETKTTDTGASTRAKAAKKPGIDWLGLDDDKDDNVKEPVPPFLAETTTTKAAAQPTILHNLVSSTTTDLPISNDRTNVISTTAAAIGTVSAESIATDVAAANLNLIHVASLEKEQALHSLQQQQTQLRVAAQMKQQEHILHDMHRKQQILIKQQENQFGDLLQRQISRQNQLETHIQHQQEQINAYITTLMSQPSIGLIDTTMPAGADGDRGRTNDVIDETRQHTIELEADVKRLGLEKLRLEDTLQSVQTSHERELDLLQSSHK